MSLDFSAEELDEIAEIESTLERRGIRRPRWDKPIQSHRAQWSDEAQAVYDGVESLLPPLRAVWLANVWTRVTREIDPRPCEPLRPEDANWGEE